MFALEICAFSANNVLLKISSSLQLGLNLPRELQDCGKSTAIVCEVQFKHYIICSRGQYKAWKEKLLKFFPPRFNIVGQYCGH